MTIIKKSLLSALAFMPWAVSMYLLYWLEKSGTFTAETAFRDPANISIVATGMLLSFAVHTYIGRNTN
ncbi:MAG: hypothetical protein AB8B48_07100 [Pseudomonadales bacterium]